MIKYCLLFTILSAGISQYEAAECPEKPPGNPVIYYLHIDSYIKYRYATTTVVSKVANSANNSQEIFFYMNLPETAFITSFAIEIDGEKYDAYIKEKEEAKKIYDTAVMSGQSAGHVATSSRDSNQFKISVNVEANGKITFTLKYEELLQRTLGKYKQIINLNPGQTVRDLKVNVHIFESSNIKNLFVPELKVTNEIDTEEKENKNIDIVRKDHKAVIKYEPAVEEQEKVGGKCFEGQFIVEYDVDRIHPCGQVLIDDGYFVHFYGPEGLKPLRKLVVFVLDLSGSMYGRKLTQMKEAMNTILDELREDDYFSLIEFSFSVTVHNLDSPTGSAVISPDPYNYNPEIKLPSSLELQRAYIASKDNVNKTKQIISKMTAGGGTNIYDALKTAIQVSQKALNIIRSELKDKENEEPLEPMIMFLTDGEPTVSVTNIDSIRSTVRELNVPKTSIFSIGFGRGADMKFLKDLSKENGGFGKKVYEASDAHLQLRHFYQLISSPLLSNVTFTYLEGQVNNETLTKKEFRSLFDGGELVVAGKVMSEDSQNGFQSKLLYVSSNGTDSCTVQGSKVSLDSDSKSEDEANPAVIAKPSQGEKKYGSLERLWAYLTIKQLLDKRDTTEGTQAKEDLKKSALNLALQYKFVTPLTSLVVVRPNKTEALPELEESDGPVHHLASSPAYRPLTFGAGGGSYNTAFQLPRPGIPGPPSHSFGMAAISRPNFLMTSFPSSSISNSMVMTLPHMSLPAYFNTATTNRPSTTDSSSIAEASTLSDTNTEASEEKTDESKNSTLTLADLEWLNQVITDNVTMAMSVKQGDATESYVIQKISDSTKYDQCQTPKNETGKCTHLVNCIQPEFTKSLDAFWMYFCPIPGKFVGVCCPEPSIPPSS